MTSNQFSNISDSLIADYLEGTSTEAEAAEVIDSIESSTDLWLMAHMQQSYDAIENETADDLIAGCGKDALIRVSDDARGSVDCNISDRQN